MNIARINLIARQPDGGKRNGEHIVCDRIRALSRRMRTQIDSFEKAARFSGDCAERMGAISAVIGKAAELDAGLGKKRAEAAMVERDGMRSELPSVLLEEMERCRDACQFALERMTWADDPAVRGLAFEVVSGNEAALRVACAISPHGDIRARARNALPRRKPPKPDDKKGTKPAQEQKGTGAQKEH